MVGAPFLLHETLGCPIANLHSARSDLWEPQFVLHPTQLRKKHCFVKSTSNDLTAVGITTCLPSELTSSLRIGEFPCRLLRTKNHHFAALRFPDFQRKPEYMFVFISAAHALGLVGQEQQRLNKPVVTPAKKPKAKGLLAKILGKLRN